MTTGHPACEQVHPHPVGRRVLLNPIDDDVQRLTNPRGDRSVFANSLNYATTPLVVLEARPDNLLPLPSSFYRPPSLVPSLSVRSAPWVRPGRKGVGDGRPLNPRYGPAMRVPCAATMTTRQEEDVAADATPGPDGHQPNGPPEDQSPPASPQGELYSPAAGEWEEYARRGQAAHSELLRKG